MGSLQFTILMTEQLQLRSSKTSNQDNSHTLNAKSFKKRYNSSFIKFKGQQMQANLTAVGYLSQILLLIIFSYTKKDSFL